MDLRDSVLFCEIACVFERQFVVLRDSMWYLEIVCGFEMIICVVEG